MRDTHTGSYMPIVGTKWKLEIQATAQTNNGDSTSSDENGIHQH